MPGRGFRTCPTPEQQRAVAPVSVITVVPSMYYVTLAEVAATTRKHSFPTCQRHSSIPRNNMPIAATPTPFMPNLRSHNKQQATFQRSLQASIPNFHGHTNDHHPHQRRPPTTSQHSLQHACIPAFVGTAFRSPPLQTHFTPSPFIPNVHLGANCGKLVGGFVAVGVATTISHDKLVFSAPCTIILEHSSTVCHSIA